MLDTLLRYPEIKAYLSVFPREDWPRCIAATLRMGIRWMRRGGSKAWSVDELEHRVEFGQEPEGTNALKDKMSTLKRELETMSRDLSDLEGSYPDKPKKTAPKLSKREKKPVQSRAPVLQPTLASSPSLSTIEWQFPSSVRSVRNVDLPKVTEPRVNEELVSQLSSGQPSSRQYTDFMEAERPEDFLSLAEGFLESPLVKRFL